MGLSRVDRERLNDSRLKLQSVSNSLSQVDPRNVPDFDDIQQCLDNASRSLRGALRTHVTDTSSDKPR